MAMIRSLLLILAAFFIFYSSSGQKADMIKKFEVMEAKQAVAVDRNYFYVINNSTITKHNKEDGTLTAKWDGTEEGISHLNSGVVIRGRLYCASSNYPDSPMAGSVEIFDASSLKHIGNHSFGIYTGSLTWIDQHNGYWFAGFAHYTGSGSSEGKDTRWTSVVKFNRKWQRIESWTFPENIIKLFMPKSNSGAAFGKDGKLYCTGHDRPEIYVMEIPGTGFTLKHTKTIETPVYGQGIAFDDYEKNKKIIYGISREDNLVIAFEIE